MPSRGLRLRMGTREDSPTLVSLLNDTFRTPIDAATWEWYAFGNPNGPSRIYLAESDDGEIVGMVAFSPLFLRFQGTPVPSDYAHHLAVKPAYRDTFSYMALMQYALKAEEAFGVKVAIGPPNRMAYPIHKKLTKWVEFGFLERLRKVSPAPEKHSCRELHRFSQEFDSFYERISGGLDFCLEKNATWMNWRFFRRPGSPYKVYAVGAGSDLSGYVILKRWQDENGYRKVHIMDLHTTDEAALQELLAAAESYAVECGELNLWVIQGYPYRHWLESRGFTTTAVDYQPLLARPFNGFAPIFPRGCCSLSYGDGDTQY